MTEFVKKTVTKYASPFQPLLIEGAGDRDKGQVPMDANGVPKDYISYRVTTEDRNIVYDIFRDVSCVIAEEMSRSGVRHFHIVVAGHDHYELLKKRLARAKLGVNKYWSKKNHKDNFLAAISYTIKSDDDYKCRRGFAQWCDKAPPWVWHTTGVPEVEDGVRDKDSDWMLSWNNILRIAFNHRKRNGIKSTDLGTVLEHLTKNTRWIPSIQMLRTGLDPWHFNHFTWMCSDEQGRPPAWWVPRIEGTHKPVKKDDSETDTE